MSRNSDNPFAALKASRFPDARKKRRTTSLCGTGGTERRENDADTENELFMLAMSRVEKLLPREKKDEKHGPMQSGAAKSRQRLRPGADSPAEASSSMSFPTANASGKEKDSAESSESSAFPNLSVVWSRNHPAAHSIRKGAGAEMKGKDAPRHIPAVSPPPVPQPAEDTSEDEAGTFFSAMIGITPLAGRGRAVRPEPPLQDTPPSAASNPLQDIVDGKVEFALSGTAEFMEGHVVGLDLLTVGKLQAGQFSPEAHIDLHGLNSEQAFHHLVGFFRNAYYKGVRTALVVTGRGLNSPDGNPVLRAKIRQWFTQEPFRRIILAFCTARREDGGTGALYVLLRKYRKSSGKVRWDALPADPDLFLQ